MALPRRLLAILLLGWVLWPAMAQAAAEPAPVELLAIHGEESLAGRSSYWIDDSARATPTEAEAVWRSGSSGGEGQSFALRQAAMLHAIHGKALWIRFVAVQRTPDVRWLLEVGLPGVDRVSLFYRDAQGAWMEQLAGDSIAISQWPMPDRFPVFALAPPSDRPVEYFVRIEHQRVLFSAPLTLYSPTALVAQREREHFILGVYFGLAALAVLMGLVPTLVHRDRSFAAYTAYVALLMIAQACYMGLAAQYLWPNAPVWNNAASFLTPALAACAGLFFVWQVIVPEQFSRRLDRVVRGWIALSVTAALVDAIWPSRIGFSVVNTCILGIMVLIYLMYWLALRRGDRYARWIAIGFLPVVVAASFPLARNFGLLPVNFLTAYALAMGAAVEIPILLYAITQRAAHRRESQARASALARTDPLTALSNQHILLTRLHEALLRAQRYGYPCALLLVEVVNHDWFAKEHGRETAERALVLAASRMRRLCRDVDTAARVGDRQFALLIEGPCNSALVVNTATHVLAGALRPSDLLPIGSQLKLRICAALLPDAEHAPGSDAYAALRWMQQELASMQDEPRKLIKSINF